MKGGVFHRTGGILSGPNALDVLVCFRTVRSSDNVNSAVEMSSSSEIRVLGKENPLEVWALSLVGSGNAWSN